MKYGIKYKLRKRLIKYAKNINENIESIDDWVEHEDMLTSEIFNNIKNGNKITFDLMPPNQYHHALKEFMRFGEFNKFPIKYIIDWKGLMLTNISKLSILTSIAGHTSSFPYDEFYDVFDNDSEEGERSGEFTHWCNKIHKENGKEDYINDYNFYAVSEFLHEVYNIDNVLPLFSNGQWLLSDFGLKPLFKLGEELITQNDPNEIIVTINRILDVSHQRSDLAEIFIEGGTKSLDYISNS